MKGFGQWWLFAKVSGIPLYEFLVLLYKFAISKDTLTTSWCTFKSSQSNLMTGDCGGLVLYQDKGITRLQNTANSSKIY